MVRRPQDITGLLVGVNVSGIAYWAAWSAGFSFVLPFVAAVSNVRERSLLLMLDVGSGVSGAISCALLMAIWGRVRRVRYGRVLGSAFVGWLIAAIAPGRAFAGLHAVPPMSLVFQLPAVFVVMMLGMAIHGAQDDALRSSRAR